MVWQTHKHKHHLATTRRKSKIIKLKLAQKNLTQKQIGKLTPEDEETGTILKAVKIGNKTVTLEKANPEGQYTLYQYLVRGRDGSVLEYYESNRYKPNAFEAMKKKAIDIIATEKQFFSR